MGVWGDCDTSMAMADETRFGLDGAAVLPAVHATSPIDSSNAYTTASWRIRITFRVPSISPGLIQVAPLPGSEIKAIDFSGCLANTLVA